MVPIENTIKEGSKVQIKSPLLNIDNLSLYDLNLFISPFEFSFIVLDTNTKQCLRLESVVFKEQFESGKNDQVLLDIFQDNPLLPAAFWKNINVYISNRCFTLVPNDYFTEANAELFLQTNTAYNKESCDWSYQNQRDFTVVFGYKKTLKKVFKKIYPNRMVNFYSNISTLLDIEVAADNLFYLYQDNSLITLVVYKNNKFEYANVFLYKNLDDILYYTLLIYKELNFKTDEVNLILSGSVETQTILQSRLLKYIKNVALATRPNKMKLCYNFDEIDENRFFNLLNIKSND